MFTNVPTSENNELTKCEISPLYKVLKDAEEKTVKYGRGYWTRYELISQLVDDVLAHVEEFQYKWSFLPDLSNFNLNI